MTANHNFVTARKAGACFPVFIRSKIRIGLCLLLLFTALPAPARDWQWSGVNRVVAVGDVHGAYTALVDILKSADLVDDHLDWKGGTAHLVMDGDILDRGPGVRRLMDLIMKLQPQAVQAGGMVHMVLGNHEVMNLTGDLRYVTKTEFASYADDADPADRQAALERFRARNSEPVNDETLLQEFNKKYPPGFFGHQKLFSAHGRYGQWLAGRPVMIKINDTLFVHAGLSQQVQATNGEALNNAYSRLLHEYLADWALLAKAGILPVETGFYRHANTLQAYLKQQAEAGVADTDPLIQTAKQLLALNESPLLGIDSVFWYRGNDACNTVMAESELDHALRQFGGARLVVGHTPTYNRRVLSRFNGKLIRADTGILKSAYHGLSSAVIINHDRVAVLYPGQNGLFEATPQSRFVGARAGQLTDDELASVLANAVIKSDVREEDGSRLLQLEYDGQLLSARFTPAVNPHKNRMFIPEVAAYRLDRMLGIDMVPVTVVRLVAGEPGAVMLTQDSLISEQKRHEERRGAGAWCPLPDQFNLMYVFDMLTYNQGRTLEQIRYTPESWQLVLTGNRNLFAARDGIPRYLTQVHVTLPGRLVDRLKALDNKQLTQHLADVLDARRRRALLQRRDEVLKTAHDN